MSSRIYIENRVEYAGVLMRLSYLVTSDAL